MESRYGEPLFQLSVFGSTIAAAIATAAAIAGTKRREASRSLGQRRVGRMTSQSRTLRPPATPRASHAARERERTIAAERMARPIAARIEALRRRAVSVR